MHPPRMHSLAPTQPSPPPTLAAAAAGSHVRIVHGGEGQGFFALDGAEGKCSLNGTWYRLSAIGSESPSVELCENTEFVVGESRFVVHLDRVIAQAS